MPRGADDREKKRSRGWLFTIFSLDRDTVPDWPDSTYAISGRETTKSGRFHWQCYAHWDTLKSFEQVKEIHPGAHCTAARGTPQHNRVYCSKDGDFVETGDVPQQGKRSDIAHVAGMLAGGADAAKIAAIHPGHVLRLHGRFQAYRDIIDPPKREREVTTHVFWGETGVGKTRRVMSEAPDVYWIPYHDGKRIWMDAYAGQLAICLDDFDGSLDFRLLLHLTDRYTRQWPVKGGFVVSRWNRVYITSDQHPSGWYGSAMHYSQLKRRLSLIECLMGEPQQQTP